MITPLLIYLLYAIALYIVLGRTGHRSRPISVETTSTSSNPSDRPRKILIVGATGGTGRQLVARALERGHEVTAFVRNPSEPAIEHSRLTVVQGDVLDPSSLDAAMRGQEAVVSALGHKRYFYPTRILSEGTRNILDAMARHGVSRLVCET
ncbi:MAG TPA: NAD(P)H-binding protein, partial [Rhodothermia bacterium]|nr:NAD(P)H-binding protein [Rhodothermia bacterium]